MEVSMEYLIITEQSNKKRIMKESCKKNRTETIKIITYQKFIKNFYFDYTKETIYYLSKTHSITKEIAEIYIRNLYNIRETKEKIKKVEDLKQIKQELIEQELLEFNPLWKEKLKSQKLVFYHISKKDKFFEEIINQCKKITEVQIIDYNSKPQNYKVKEYLTLEKEVIGVLSEICTLLKNKENSANIYLANITDNYQKYLNLYANLFHIPLSLKNNESYNSNLIVTEFIKEYDNGMKEAIELLKEKYPKDEEQKIIHKIINVCNEYAFITEEKEKKSFILSELQNIKPPTKENIYAIKEIDFLTEDVDTHAHLFILGVDEGNFPKLQQDEQYLTNKERTILNLSTSEEQNQINKLAYLTKLDWYQNTHLSYAKKDGKLEMYLSSIFEERTITIEPSNEETLSHSHIFNQLLLAKKIDTLKKYGTKEHNLQKLFNTYPNISYNNYKNAYTKVNIPNTPLKLSYTSLDVFFHCAFRYYLQYVLKINDFQESFEIKIGRLFHQILMEFYQKDFDFEKSWQKNIQEIKFITKKEKFFQANLKKDLKRVLDTLKKQEEGKNFQAITEETFNYDFGKNIILTGIIDKIYHKEENGKNLISIIDYKTGTPNLNLDNLPYGLNMQLPIYQLLLKKLSKNNIELIGFYLQKILPNIPERDKIHTEEELKQQSLKLQGYSTDKESILSIFDPTYENSKLIKGMKKSSKGFYSYAKILTEENFQKIEEIALKNIDFAIQEINERRFNINPIRIAGKRIGCDYCPYESICYRKEQDIKNKKEQKLMDILGGEKHANMDERAE